MEFDENKQVFVNPLLSIYQTHNTSTTAEIKYRSDPNVLFATCQNIIVSMY